MPRRGRLDIVFEQIARVLDRGPRRCLTTQALARVLEKNREKWRLPPSIGPSKFIGFLRDRPTAPALEAIEVSGPNKVFSRYVWREASPYDVGLSLRDGAYLSHGTAAFLHGFTNEVPKVIYVNKEQSPKPVPPGPLTQEALDRAFGGAQRESTYVFHWNIYRFVLLNGKASGNYAVDDLEGEFGEELSVTSPERTLVDVVVRPAYVGGIVGLLEAYRRARERVDPARLLTILRKLEYKYPYHQTIGYLMEHAGYPAEALTLFEKEPRAFNFYAVHGMREPVLDPRWRLYVPRGF